MSDITLPTSPVSSGLTVSLSELEVTLIEDVLAYAADHFDADDAKSAALFTSTIEQLQAKLSQARPSSSWNDLDWQTRRVH